MNTQIKIFALILIQVIYLFSFQSSAMTDQELNQIVELMCQSGQSEEKIAATVKTMKEQQDLERKIEEYMSAGMTAEQASMKANGWTDEEILAAENEAKKFEIDRVNAIREKWQAKVKVFREVSVNKPDSIVTIDGVAYNLKVLSCDSDGAKFDIYAEGAPRNNTYLELTIWSAPDSNAPGPKDWLRFVVYDKDYDSISMNIYKPLYGVDPIALNGNAFTYDGIGIKDGDSVEGEQSVQFKVHANCS